jgi:anti-sigma regulatory factor (Ser/Thr protein kinase)
VSELVANVVRHSDLGPTDEMTVRVEEHGHTIRVEVTDHGGRYVAEPQVPDRGQGLYLVDRLSPRWGVDREGSGTRAWFELEP